MTYKIEDFDFDLPNELIAQKPAKPRDSSRLLIMKNGTVEDKKFWDLVDILPKDCLLIMNNTKVIPSFLIGKKGKGEIKINLHKRIDDFSWLVFAKKTRKLKLQDKIIFSNNLYAIVENITALAEVELRFNLGLTDFMTEIEKIGHMPLPPYIKNDVQNNKHKKQYQTIFAQEEGAIAAPTAGLHFSAELLKKIKEKGIEIAFVTLHVGAGTFLPVKVKDIREHTMHSEYITISAKVANLINQYKKNNKKIVAIGTTSLRVLESVATTEGIVKTFCGETDIFIYPSFKFKIVDILLTNFHIPRSTLFMLISAFYGLENSKKAYNYAIEHKYRFFSYGDACLIYRK